jgi:hypothetical protein
MSALLPTAYFLWGRKMDKRSAKNRRKKARAEAELLARSAPSTATLSNQTILRRAESVRMHPTKKGKNIRRPMSEADLLDQPYLPMTMAVREEQRRLDGYQFRPISPAAGLQPFRPLEPFLDGHDAPSRYHHGDLDPDMVDRTSLPAYQAYYGSNTSLQRTERAATVQRATNQYYEDRIIRPASLAGSCSGSRPASPSSRPASPAGFPTMGRRGSIANMDHGGRLIREDN